jgi:hypothetical protein
MTDDKIQLRTADGKYDGEIVLDTYAGAVNVTAFGPDGNRIEYGRELPAATARKLAAGLLACADAAEGKPAT